MSCFVCRKYKKAEERAVRLADFGVKAEGIVVVQLNPIDCSSCLPPCKVVTILLNRAVVHSTSHTIVRSNGTSAKFSFVLPGLLESSYSSLLQQSPRNPYRVPRDTRAREVEMCWTIVERTRSIHTVSENVESSSSQDCPSRFCIPRKKTRPLTDWCSSSALRGTCFVSCHFKNVIVVSRHPYLRCNFFFFPFFSPSFLSFHFVTEV